jgi:hypothetical protein
VATLVRRLRGIAAWLAIVFLFSAVPARAQDNVRLAEQDIKAGLLYNFLRYTQWPEGGRAEAPMVVCIYGLDPFSGRLAPMAGRTVNQRRIELRTIGSDAEIDACSLLYLNAQARRDWPRIRAHLAGRHVLTVSDYDGFARSGGMIEFARVDDRVAVRINVRAAEAADLLVQDRLLRLASIVRSDGS